MSTNQSKSRSRKAVNATAKCIISAIILAFVLCFSGCGRSRFDESDIIGKTSAEIIDKYGDFDRKQGQVGSDELYRDCACGYLVKDRQKGFFGTSNPEYFMIYFDENGIAHFCKNEEIV